MHETLIDLLAHGADAAPAITAPSRAALSFGALRTLIQTTVARLNALGIGRNDRVAIVLHNGPEMASCYVACGVTSAPLNPAYRAEEFEFYLSDLNAKALIVEPGSHSAATEMATKLGVRLIDLVVPPGAPAGQFTLQPRDDASGPAAAAGGLAAPGDVSPLVESYGMTESAHQMASNPLPPGLRKPGTVGRAAGPQMAIMADDGTLLPPGSTGEIVVRGPSVAAGYENNPKANAEAYHDGWFRTGDQGVIDADGHISITGRLKEIINRGGEKISPREVDEIMMDHPAVAQVVCFGMPHPKLGEEIAACVVLREGQVLSERELQAFAGIHAADYKVPKKILFMDEIPKGATGKLQRIGLAAKLGLG